MRFWSGLGSGGTCRRWGEATGVAGREGSKLSGVASEGDGSVAWLWVGDGTNYGVCLSGVDVPSR